MRDTHLVTVLRKRDLKLVEFARLVGVDKGTVSRWSASRIPAERVIEIETLTTIPRDELRPDLYPTAAVPAPCQPSYGSEAPASGGNAAPLSTGGRP